MGVAEIQLANRQLIIRSVFFFYGKAASDSLSKQVAEDIEQHWNEADGKIKLSGSHLSVTFRIEGVWARTLQPSAVIENYNPYHNYFRIEEFVEGNISFVDAIGSNTGYFKLDNLLNNSTTAAHEYGHTLGLKHPDNLDIRGFGQPAIMYPRGTLVDPEFQYDPTKPAGQPGGTINPFLRKVTPKDIEDLNFTHLDFDKKGKAIIGAFTNIWHDAHIEK